MPDTPKPPPPPGWHPDPDQPDTLRYWDGSAWTDQRAPMQVTEGAASPGKETRGWRTWLVVAVTAVVALLIGVGIGLAGTETDDLEQDLAKAEDERDEAESALDDAEAALAAVQADLRQAKADARRAEAQAERAGDSAAAAQEPAAVEPAPSGQEDSGGTYTDGDFAISDVQVSEDFVGDFEIRARVTNNGDAADFVDIQATLFNEGSVVSDLEALEEFEAGQTRTVTFVGTDKYGPWDEIEFTVDVGL